MEKFKVPHKIFFVEQMEQLAEVELNRIDQEQSEVFGWQRLPSGLNRRSAAIMPGADTGESGADEPHGCLQDPEQVQIWISPASHLCCARDAFQDLYGFCSSVLVLSSEIVCYAD